jgi:two-component system OmpR family sensor kinase
MPPRGAGAGIGRVIARPWRAVARPWRAVARLSARTPLRIKMITAVLALVIIALVVISVASVFAFRRILVHNADKQVTEQFAQDVSMITGSPGFGSRLNGSGSALITVGSSVEEIRAPNGLVQQIGFGRWTQPDPNSPSVPPDQTWLKTNARQLVTVPAISGSDKWRVITQQLNVQSTDPDTGQPVTRTYTLIVGVDLGDLNAAIAQLTSIDLIVALIVVLVLAIVGIAVVRASLRPLTDIEETAEDIAAGHLDRRVPERDPRTEVGRLGRSLNAMLTQIETAFLAQEESETAARLSEERMRQFIADASHELRTPLTAIRGYSEYYRQRGGLGDRPGDNADAAGILSGNGSGALTGADLDRIMQRVEQEAARMGILVEDLLLLARLDQQRPLERRPVDLLALAADAVQDARMIAPDRDVSFIVGSGGAFLVLGDEVRLRQVIGNLMSNALTHTPEGTPVEVRVAFDGGMRRGPGVLLEVTDQGPGLAPEQAKRVFERFYRADQARTRKTGGTGLGLAIVSALVHAHGGSASVLTEPGRGATFRIVLPLAPDAQGEDPDQDKEAGSDVIESRP